MKLRINILVIVLGVITLANVYGQQEPQYTQYMFNMMSVNPAYAGTREAMNALVISRLQWVGLEGAPRSNTFALHTPINDKRIGIGASIITDNIGPVTNTYLNLNYAHRFNIAENVKVSLGLKGGIYNYYAGLADINTVEIDNSFSDDYKKSFQPNLGAGFYLYSDDFYFGFSVPKLVQTELESVGTGDVVSELKRHYFFTAGYVFKINEQWKLKPSVLNKMVQGAPPSLDITAQAIYNDKIWLGTTYRVGDALAFLFEVQATRQLIVGYAFDATTSEMRHINNGTHEILISYDFAGFSNNRVKSPRYF